MSERLDKIERELLRISREIREIDERITRLDSAVARRILQLEQQTETKQGTE